MKKIEYFSFNKYMEKRYNGNKNGFATCNFFTRGEFYCYVFIDKVFSIVPANVYPFIDNGNIDSIRFRDYCKNLINNYPSCVTKSIDIVTEEIVTLNFYKIMELVTSHNVFTSILYAIAVFIPKNQFEVFEKFRTILDITDLSLIDSNYHIYINRNTECRKLVVLETKIFFWWYFINKDKPNIKHQGYFAFYLWIFRNIEHIDTPTIFGDKSGKNIPGFKKYFDIIDNCTSLRDLFILRYGPKYLSHHELLFEPEKIFTFFNIDKCSENLRNYLVK